jgi:uncharacterized protein (TIGR02001 family)
MKRFFHRILSTSALALALGSAIACLPAYAEDAAPAASPAPVPTWTFPTSVSFVSDYIFRGQSQSWGRPALQLSVEADHAAGAYVGFAASNVSKSWLPGAEAETDFFGGYRNKIADTVAYDVGVIDYVYGGGNWKKSTFEGYNDSNGLNTAEAYVSLNYKWLTLKTGRTLTEYFGWSTNNSPVGSFNGDPDAGVTGNTRGSMYYEANASYDVAEGWNLSGQLGRQTIHNATGLDIMYFKVGVTKSLPANWSVGVFYSGSDEPDAYKHYISLKNGSSQSDVARDKVFVNVTKAF